MGTVAFVIGCGPCQLHEYVAGSLGLAHRPARLCLARSHQLHRGEKGGLQALDQVHQAVSRYTSMLGAD